MSAKHSDLSPEQALARLLAGNEAYRTHTQNPAPLTQELREKTAGQGQQPFAAVLCCADSRVPAEHIFSAGLGELFVIRNAGNAVSPSALASVAYAVLHLHVPLVLVLGHRGCGAVAAALCAEEEPGALGEWVAQLRLRIGAASSALQAEQANVRSAVRELSADPLLQAAFADGDTALRGAIYDIRSGEVRLLSEP